jgi:hypothetical protein
MGFAFARCIAQDHAYLTDESPIYALTPINLAAALAEAFCRFDLFTVHPECKTIPRRRASLVSPPSVLTTY